MLSEKRVLKNLIPIMGAEPLRCWSRAPDLRPIEITVKLPRGLSSLWVRLYIMTNYCLHSPANVNKSRGQGLEDRVSKHVKLEYGSKCINNNETY